MRPACSRAAIPDPGEQDADNTHEQQMASRRRGFLGPSSPCRAARGSMLTRRAPPPLRPWAPGRAALGSRSLPVAYALTCLLSLAADTAVGLLGALRSSRLALGMLLQILVVIALGLHRRARAPS